MCKILVAFFFMLLPLSICGQGLVFQRITTANGLSNNQVQHIEQLADGRMIFVSWRGINIYDGARVTAFPRRDERTVALPHYTQGYAATIGDDGLVWVKEFGRLWCFDVKRGEMRSDIPSLLRSEGEELLDVYFTDGKTWLLTAKGLTDPSSKKTMPLPCDAEEIMSVEAEGDALLLFCRDGGLQVVKGGKAKKAACPNIPELRHIHEIRTAKGPDGKFYRKLYGDRYSRIDRFDMATCAWQMVMEQPMVLYGMSWVDGQLVVGCRHGYFKDGKLQPSFLTESDGVLEDIGVQQMFTDRRGGLWVALGDYGVLYTHPLRHRFASAKEPQTLGIPDSVVWNCHIRLSALFHFTEQRDNDNLTDSHGNQWRATHSGIIITPPQPSPQGEGAEKLPSTDVSIDKSDNKAPSPCGEGWGGVITTASGLPSDFVQSFVEDKRGRVWVGTNRGICCVTSINPLQIVNYGIHDGVPQWDAMASSTAMLEDGRIAMQFEQGWVTFYPDSVQRPAVPLTPILTSAPATTLRYFENNVTLTFTTDHYAFPQCVRYLWRINGGEWQRGDAGNVVDGQLRLNFLDLHHGKYSIEVKAATDGSEFSNAACTFSFTILPPWWQTWWAYTLYIICVIAVATFFIKQHYSRKQEQLKQQMREESLLKQIETLIKALPPTPPHNGRGVDTPALIEEAEDVEEVEKVEHGQDKTEEEEEGTKVEKDKPLPSHYGEGTGEGLDSEFVQRAIALVNQHLTDNYTVEQMAADLCMERTGLYKRLTALVNQSPQIFIRSIRLNRAVEMMKRGESITDAAYASGFNSVSYFGRCFAKEFGCSPSEYLKKHST